MTPEEVWVDRLWNEHDELKSWPKVGKRHNISAPTARRIAFGEPIGPKVRKQLGLPVLLPAPACPRHGVVHTRATCPRARVYRDLWDMPVRVLRWKIENREEI